VRVISLGRRWRRLWRRLGPDWDFERELAALDRRYREAHRFYHDWRHIRRSLAELDRARGLAAEPDALELALWYHDAVYDPKEPDNELRSALLAVNAARAAGLSAEFARAVSVLILSTRVEVPRGEAPSPGDAPGPHDEPRGEAPTPGDRALIRDIDLSVLGSPRWRYRRYEIAIRREYSWVPRREFAGRRGALLTGFLGRRSIYVTELFRARYERRARTNLQWALRRLRGVPP
jgi:predicted metal-dependent HD superfamily phosphohydrolase